MDTHYGVHGYDNLEPSMNPIFMAQGPRFKKGIVIKDPFNNVDLFHLFCRLLNIATIHIDGVDRIDIWNLMLKAEQTNPLPINNDVY